jgi:sigma54-dependent transcription regulator
MPFGESKCRSCGADILWVTMQPGGRRTPLDSVPRLDGNVERAGGTGRVVGPADDGKRRYVVHFATCPQAGDWRQGTRHR